MEVGPHWTVVRAIGHQRESPGALRSSTDGLAPGSRFDWVVTAQTHGDAGVTGEGATSLPRLAVALDPHPEGNDAAVLGVAIAQATGAEMMLLSIEPDLPAIVSGFDWRQVRRQTETMLAEARDSLAPGATTVIDSDLSIARGIERVVRAAGSDLLVVGSSRHAADSEVAIGKHARQLLHELTCALAVAARGLSKRPQLALRRIAVGFDGGPEAHAALATAARNAAGCDAQLTIRGMIDDRIPGLGWPHMWPVMLKDAWQDMMAQEARSLRERIEVAADALGVTGTVDVQRGRASASLLALSEQVDLLVIGSRRWGPLAPVLLGGTGQELGQGARCSLLVVPRPGSLP